MIWVWLARLLPGGTTIRCPGCASEHYANRGILRTERMHFGRFISDVTGSVNECPKCGVVFGATDRGVFPLKAVTTTAPPPNGPKPEPEVQLHGRPVPRERTSRV